MDEFTAQGGDVSYEVVEGGGLIALQGPKSVDVMARLCPDIDFKNIAFMSGNRMSVGGRDCFVTRSGYTGEDGFEIQVGGSEAESLFTQLLEQEEVKPVGLDARDSLRLEAGLCLYGNDLDDTTTPIEAALLWTIGQRRRQEGGFVGADIILKQRADKSATRKRVGFVAEGPPAREGSVILNAEGEQVGVVTSGLKGPSVGKNIGMAYVSKGNYKAG